MAYSIRLPDGSLVENIPDEITPQEAKAKILRARPDFAPKERTWGEAATDVGAGIVSGVGSVVQLPGQLYGLATGDFSKTGLLGAGEDISKYGEEMKSAGLKAREAARARKVQEAEKEGQLSAFKAALGETITDPALLTSFLAEQAPQLIPMILSGAGAGAIASRGVMSAAAARNAAREAAGRVALKEEAVKQIARESAVKAGTTAAIQTGAVMQGADVGAGSYDEIYGELRKQGVPEEQAAAETINKARLAGVAGYGLSVLANRYLPGGKALEEILAGKKITGGRIGAGVVTGLKEIPGENIEEVGGRIAQNIAAQQAGLDRELLAGTGETAAMATIGAAGMGGGAGLLAGRAPTRDIPLSVDQTTDTTQQQDQTTDTTQEQESAITSLADIFADKPAPKTSPDIEALQAKYDQREAEIKELEARGVSLTGQERGLLHGKRRKQKKLKAQIDALTQTPPTGEEDVTGTESTAVGAGTTVPAPATDELSTSAGAEPSERDGMVSTGPDATVSATGEEPTFPAVTPPDVAAVTPPDVAAVTPPDVAAVTPPDVAAVTPPDVAAVTPPDVAAVTPPDVAAVTPPDVAAVTPPDVAAVAPLPPELQVGADLLNAIDAGGVPLNPAKINAVARNIGLEVSKSAKPEETISRIREAVTRAQPQPTGETLGTQAPQAQQTETQGQKPAAAPAVTATTRKTKLDADEAFLDSLLGDDGLPSRGSAELTPEQVKQEAKIKALAADFGLVRIDGESTQQLARRLKLAVAERRAAEQEFVRRTTEEGEPLAAIEDQLIAKQSLVGKKPVTVPTEQREMYEEMREGFNQEVEDEAERLPAFENLTPDEKIKYFQENISRNSWDEHERAAESLSNYIESKRTESEEATRRATKRGVPQKASESQRREAQDLVRAGDSYQRERLAFSRKTGIAYELPNWGSLSKESQRAYASINKTDTVLEQDMAFRAVKKQVQKEQEAERSRVGLEEAERRSTQEMEAAAERARASQPAGKGEILPLNVIKMLGRGDIQGVLRYLNEDGNGLRSELGTELVRVKDKKGNFVSKRKRVKVRDSVAQNVFRSLAGALANVEGLKVNVVFDKNMIYDQLARYNANTNTLYVGPKGLDEATVLHELTHAATVKIIHQFFTDKTKLDARQIAAVEQIQNIASYAKRSLGSNKKYFNAFENLYEFVAYAMTDMDFQYQLAQIQVPSLATATNKTTETFSPIQTELEAQRRATGGEKQYDGFMDNLWNSFTGTLAYMYGLFRPTKTTIKVLVPTDLSRDINPGKGLTGKAKEEAIRRYNIKARAEAELGLSGTRKAYKKALERVDAENAAAAESEQLSEPEKFDKALEMLEAESRGEVEATDSLFDDPEAEKQSADIPAYYGNTTERGVTNLRRAILREPGYKGNLLLEVAAAVQQIMEAPEGGITSLAGKETVATAKTSYVITKPNLTPLRVGAQYSAEQIEKLRREYGDEFEAEPVGEVGAEGSDLYAKKPAAQQQRKQAPEQDNSVEAILKRNELPELSTVSNIRKHYGTRKAYNLLKKKFQNSRDAIKRWEAALDRAGKIISSTSELNNVYTQIILSSSRAKDLYMTRVEPSASTLRNAVNEYAKATGKTIEEAARDLHVIGMARHESERRDVKYMLNVPLNKDKQTITLPGGATLNIAPSEFRIRAMNAVFSGKLNASQIKELRTALNDVVAKYADPTGFSGINGAEPGGYKSVKRDAPEYNVVGGYSSADMTRVENALYTNKDAKVKAAVDKAMKAMQGLHKATTNLDKESNYWSRPVQSVVDFYGWKNYIPLKGKSHSVGKNDELLTFNSRRLGAEMQQKERAFEGRESEADNAVIQSMVDATRAAMRAGRKDVTLAIKNSVKDKEPKKRLLLGEIVKTIPFADRYKAALEAYSGPEYVYHYNADGSVDIIKLKDKEQREAIKRTYQESQPLIDALNTVTSTIGQMHTRYNVAFGPMNFVRDALTNAFTLGAEMGPKAAAQYIGAISSKIATGGLFKAGKVSYLYESGNFAEIERLAAKDPYIASMYDYMKEARVSYLEGITSKSQQQQLQRDLSSGNLKKAKAAVDRVVDLWVDSFELASRAAAYEISKSQYMAQGKTEEEARIKALGYAKGLANFEEVGEWGRAAGAAFMFFRPAATGAVRAIEAVGPAFRRAAKGIESAMADLPPNVRDDPEAMEKFRAEYRKQQASARAMTLGLLGLGAAIYGMAYMLADDDDQGRNKVATDDASRWSRYARFHFEILGKDVIFQMPWGFGLGAFAAAGAQIASVGLGNTSVKDALTNTALIGMDSFLPLPVSRINPMDQPAAWLMDSALPSALRPFLEWTMNVDGLGREIYNNRQSRFGDAYTGGDNIPEMYKDAARMLYEATSGGIDWSPNSMYFFANNYLDGVTRMGHGAYNIALVGAGNKEFNPKTDTLMFDSFFGAPSNIDAREFSKVENKILDIKKKLNTLEIYSPDQYTKYVEKYPMHQALVDTYDHQVNQVLRDLRQEANVYRRMTDLTPKERNELVKNTVQIQNLVKRNLLDIFEAYGVEP